MATVTREGLHLIYDLIQDNSLIDHLLVVYTSDISISDIGTTQAAYQELQKQANSGYIKTTQTKIRSTDAGLSIQVNITDKDIDGFINTLTADAYLVSIAAFTKTGVCLFTNELPTKPKITSGMNVTINTILKLG